MDSPCIQRSSLEDSTGVVEDTVVKGGEGGAEVEVVELASEVVSRCQQVEGVSQPQVDDLQVQGEYRWTICEITCGRIFENASEYTAVQGSTGLHSSSALYH